MNQLAKQNEELKRKILHRKKIERESMDNSLKLYKLKQSIYNQLQDEALKGAARESKRDIDDDAQDRKMNDILVQHQDNLKGLWNSIYVAKEQQFKQATESLHAKISEIEARRVLNKKMSHDYLKAVKKYKHNEEDRTYQFMEDYQKIGTLTSQQLS